MSMGALVSRSSSYSSTFISRPRPALFTGESAFAPPKAQGEQPIAHTLCCGLHARRRRSCGFLGFRGRGRLRRSFERVDPGLQRMILLARGDGDRLHRLELVAADHVEPADPLAHPLAKG